jgi:hypothetical protein
MPNLIPGFIYQPLPIDYSKRPRRIKGRGLVGHVAVSESANLRPWDENDWHAYLPREGPGIQYIDLDYVAYTSRDGNPSMASFESQGGVGTAAQVNAEPWNDNQIRLAAVYLRHLHDTEGVPLQLMPDSRPWSRGFATHRLGIDPWRVSGGELWTKSYGKLCPGDRKHEQRIDIVRLAASGDLEDDMPSLDDIRAAIREEVGAALIAPSPGGIGGDKPRALSSMIGRGLDDTFAGKEHAAETRRMLGVLLGWRAPATANEQAALEQLRGAAVDVDEQAIATSLVDLARPMLLDAVKAGMAADNDEQADAIVDRLAARLVAPSS